jgi:hypothetical protein
LKSHSLADDDTFFNTIYAMELIKKLPLEIPGIWGGKLNKMVVEKDVNNRYVDLIWPNKTYPTYISGGGFIMNSKARYFLFKFRLLNLLHFFL